jgi:hypothetical protein
MFSPRNLAQIRELRAISGIVPFPRGFTGVRRLLGWSVNGGICRIPA